MAQYTKKAILQTFQEMLEKMPFDKITVSALAAKCEISPNTFYYHFQDIYDLLDTWLLIKKEGYVLRFSQGSRWQEGAKAVLLDMKAHSDMVYHLFNSLSRERLERSVFESTDDTLYQFVCRKTAGGKIPEPALRDVAEYNTYAFLGFLLKYLWNGMEGDVDEGIARIGYLFENNIRWLQEQYGREEL